VTASQLKQWQPDTDSMSVLEEMPMLKAHCRAWWLNQ